MKKLLVSLMLSVSSLAYAGPCAGPAFPCADSPPVEPTPTTAPSELCIAGSCAPIVYLKQVYPGTTPGPAEPGYFVLAFSSVAGYPVVGWQGPCLPAWDCPAIYVGAYNDLYNQATRVNRVMRFDAE